MHLDVHKVRKKHLSSKSLENIFTGNHFLLANYICFNFSKFSQKNHKKQMNRDMEPQEQKKVILGPRAHKVQGNRVRKEKDLIKRETRGQIWP